MNLVSLLYAPTALKDTSPEYDVPQSYSGGGRRGPTPPPHLHLRQVQVSGIFDQRVPMPGFWHFK